MDPHLLFGCINKSIKHISFHNPISEAAISILQIKANAEEYFLIPLRKDFQDRFLDLYRFIIKRQS